MPNSEFDPMKELVIDAIIGVGVPTILGVEFEKTGMVKYAGTEADVNSRGLLRMEKRYVWVRKELAAYSLEALQELYGSLKQRTLDVEEMTRRASNAN